MGAVRLGINPRLIPPTGLPWPARGSVSCFAFAWAYAHHSTPARKVALSRFKHYHQNYYCNYQSQNSWYEAPVFLCMVWFSGWSSAHWWLSRIRLALFLPSVIHPDIQFFIRNYGFSADFRIAVSDLFRKAGRPEKSIRFRAFRSVNYGILKV